MNDNRKVSLSLISVLAVLMLSMTLLYKLPSPLWICSQVFLMIGCCFFLAFAVFVYDVRSLRIFALPTLLLAIGELTGTMAQVGFLKEGIPETPGGTAVRILLIIAQALEFVMLTLAVIDLCTDFSFCTVAMLALCICCGFLVAVDLVLLMFGIVEGSELLRGYLLYTTAELLAFGTVVVFYTFFTKERRAMLRYRPIVQQTELTEE